MGVTAAARGWRVPAGSKGVQKAALGKRRRDPLITPASSEAQPVLEKAATAANGGAKGSARSAASTKHLATLKMVNVSDWLLRRDFKASVPRKKGKPVTGCVFVQQVVG